MEDVSVRVDDVPSVVLCVELVQTYERVGVSPSASEAVAEQVSSDVVVTADDGEMEAPIENSGEVLEIVMLVLELTEAP